MVVARPERCPWEAGARAVLGHFPVSSQAPEEGSGGVEDAGGPGVSFPEEGRGVRNVATSSTPSRPGGGTASLRAASPTGVTSGLRSKEGSRWEGSSLGGEAGGMPS